MISQCKMQTAHCRLGRGKMQTEGKMQTADYRIIIFN